MGPGEKALTLTPLGPNSAAQDLVSSANAALTRHIRAMAELGINISAAAGYRAKGIEDFAHKPPMDLVVTVCDEAAEECPFFPGARHQEHWGFPDSSKASGNEDERLAVFRQVRDAIATRIERWLREKAEA